MVGASPGGYLRTAGTIHILFSRDNVSVNQYYYDVVFLFFPQVSRLDGLVWPKLSHEVYPEGVSRRVRDDRYLKCHFERGARNLSYI